jgi:hypothetical protein
MSRRLAFLLVFGVAGCYGYYPPSPSAAGRDILVNLTDSGSVVLARVVGPSVVGVQGRFLSDSEGTLVVNASGVRLRDGREAPWRGERIAIPHSLIATTSERRFSRGRTTLFSGVVAVALVALRQAFQGEGGGFGGGTPGTTGPK